MKPRLIIGVLISLTCFTLCSGPMAAQNVPRVVHVFVALADNTHQGIVPVSPRLGNGDDPEHNLYWGAAYGLKTFFAHSTDWHLTVSQAHPTPAVLERCIFHHRSGNVILIADAYRGSEIRQAIVDFLKASAGQVEESAIAAVRGSANPIIAPALADLVVYVGHEGLMDFTLLEIPRPKNNADPQNRAASEGEHGHMSQHVHAQERQAIVLACISKSYFAEPLRAAGATPLLWTTSLMAPEAYTLKSALDGWVLRENPSQIRDRAAAAYSRYQHCSLAAARRLLVTGW